MKINSLRRHRQIYRATEGIFSKNMLLTYGLGIASAVVTTTNLKNALALSIAMFFTLIPTMVASSFFSEKIPFAVQISLIAVISAGGVMLSAYPIRFISPSIFESLGIYFPLMALNSAILIKCRQYEGSGKPLAAALDGLLNCIGYTFAMLTIGAIREMLSYGSLWGREFDVLLKIPGVRMPFSGFVILGFVAASGAYFGRMGKAILYRIENRKFRKK